VLVSGFKPLLDISRFTCISGFDVHRLKIALILDVHIFFYRLLVLTYAYKLVDY